MVIGKVLSYHEKLVNYLALPNQFLHVLLLRCFRQISIIKTSLFPSESSSMPF